MTESTPPEQLRQLNRDLMEKVIDRAASDPEWKQWLLDDPEAAMREAGFPEAEKLEEALTSVGDSEVQGHQLCGAVACLQYTERSEPIPTFAPR